MNNIIDIYNNILKYDNKIINFVIDKNNIIWFKFLSISNLLNYKRSKENKIRFKEYYIGKTTKSKFQNRVTF